MSGERKPPQARDRAIGAQLRSIRVQHTKFSLETAAQFLQRSTATMSRIENGKRHISAEDVAAILAIYRVLVAQRDGLIARAKAIDEPGWWSRPLPGVPQELGALASYESEANELTDWSVNIIPGLLQTYEYAKAYMLDEGTPLEDIEMVWMARLRRQQVLPAVEYTAYLGEAAIRTPLAGKPSPNSSDTSSRRPSAGSVSASCQSTGPRGALSLLDADGVSRLAPDRARGTVERRGLSA